MCKNSKRLAGKWLRMQMAFWSLFQEGWSLEMGKCHNTQGTGEIKPGVLCTVLVPLFKKGSLID